MSFSEFGELVNKGRAVWEGNFRGREGIFFAQERILFSCPCPVGCRGNCSGFLAVRRIMREQKGCQDRCFFAWTGCPNLDKSVV